jgi:hypothetical protein
MAKFQLTSSIHHSRITKSEKSQGKQPRFLQRFIALAFITQATLIGVKGNLDILSGKPVLDVIPSMLTQGIALILKAHRTQANLKKSDRNL